MKLEPAVILLFVDGVESQSVKVTKSRSPGLLDLDATIGLGLYL